MNLKFILTMPLLMIFVGNRCGNGRSAHQEMKQLRDPRKVEVGIDLNEYWPFPKAINEYDPFLFELENQLIELKPEN